MVKTSRSTAVEQKTFFPIKYTDFDIYDFSLFLDRENFKKIINTVSDDLEKEDSLDFQFYFDSEEIHLAQISFCDVNMHS